MAKPLQKCLEWVYKKFSENPAGMLITTSVIGWLLSMAAQVIAIAVNPKIKDEQKVFLIPQEFNDAIVNIGAFLLITQFTKRIASHLFSTGKFAPKCVRDYLNTNAKQYKGKVGNLDLNLDRVLEHANPEIKRAYTSYKEFGTTAATVGAGIFAANIVTPVIRNKMASRVQKSYINVIKPDLAQKTTLAESKVGETEVNEMNTLNDNTQVQKVPSPQFQSLHRTQINTYQNIGNLRI